MVLVLRPTRHKTGHFGDVPQANLLAWYGKTKRNTTKARIHQSKEMYYNAEKTQKLKSGLVTSYDIRPENREGLFWFRRFINLSLTYLLRHLPTYSPGTHMGPEPLGTRGTGFYGSDVLPFTQPTASKN